MSHYVNENGYTVIRGKNPVISNSDKSFNITNKTNKNISNISKAVDSDEPPAPKKVTLDMANEMKNDRNKLSLTRSDLGKKLAISEKIIASYEQEGTIIEMKYYSKIRNYLKNAINNNANK